VQVGVKTGPAVSKSKGHGEGGMSGDGGGKFSDVYSSKVTKNEDERMSYILLV